MEERKSYFYIFEIALIPFFIGLITKRIILSFITVTALVGTILFVQNKRGYIWDYRWREWLSRADSPLLFWTIIGFETLIFLYSFELLFSSAIEFYVK